MTTIARTNIAISPQCTAGVTVNAGTGGAASATTVTGASDGPLPGITNYARMTVTTAKTGGSSGWTATSTANQIPAPSTLIGDVCTISAWVRYTGSGTITAGMEHRFIGAGTQFTDSAQFNLPSGQWVRVAVTATATATYSKFGWWVFNPATSIMPVGSTLDVTGLLVEMSSTLTTYFDGGTAAHDNFAYQWTGTANASTSQEYYALPTVLAVAKTDAPCPRTEVTVVGLGTGTTVYTVWRTADGTRQAVRGARRRSGVDSDFVVDYEAPLNRSLSYDVEVISGTQVTQPTYPATATVASVTWWIQDPLVPSSAIPLNVSKQDSNAPYLTGNAIKALEYGASVTLIPILGSTDPVALMGNRTIAGNVSFDMFTNLASVTTQLRNLIQQTPLLLIRSTGTRNNGIPGLAYFTSAKPVEKPVTVAFGGTLTNWALTGDLVAAPTMNVLVPIWTYGTVAALWATYQQAQTTLAGKTYLDVLKSPSGV